MAVTQWVNSRGRGRGRGPLALARAWIGVVIAPRRFFARAVTPGDQAPGLLFLAVVVAIEEGTRFVLVSEAVPVYGGRPIASFVLVVLLSVVLVAPAGLHLLAALQTVLLWPLAADRAGISETVQVLAYATAPCVVAGLPIAAIRVAAAVYGTVLLAVGLSTVHDIGPAKAILAAAIPATLLFGVAFRGLPAVQALV